ncbi:signal peptidase I [Wolinella succinogenes]|uniref:signal peptidase I n=1 Tax=Wolinella succinogenes TaxID=844 RepID=UPI002FCA36BE
MKWFKKLYDFANSWTGTLIIVLGIIFFVAQAFVIPSGSMIGTMLIGDNLFVKKFAYGTPTPRLPWLEWKVLPDFNDNGHLIEGDRPKRGDIVIFRFPLQDTIHYVKRCVAKEGDEVIYAEEGLYFRPIEGDAYIHERYKGVKTRHFFGKLFVYDPYLSEHPGVHYEKKTMNAFAQMLHYASANQLFMSAHRSAEGEIFFYHKVEKDHFFMMGDNRDNSNDSRFWGSVPYKNVVGKPWFVYFSWDEDYKIRWNRIGKSIETLEDELRDAKAKEAL